MIKNVDVFKKELQSYEFYRSKLDELYKELDNIEYQLKGVKGIRYDKTSSGNSKVNADRRYILYEEKAQKELEIARIESNIKSIDIILDKLDESIRGAVIDIYVKGYTYDTVCNSMNIAKSALYKRIERSLMSVLK